MDPEEVAGMVFTLIILTMVGGFFLLLPLTRRLGEFLEWRMRERSGGGDAARELAQLRRQMERLSEQVASLQERQGSLQERQDFVDSLLQARTREALPGRGVE